MARGDRLEGGGGREARGTPGAKGGAAMHREGGIPEWRPSGVHLGKVSVRSPPLDCAGQGRAGRVMLGRQGARPAVAPSASALPQPPLAPPHVVLTLETRADKAASAQNTGHLAEDTNTRAGS